MSLPLQVIRVVPGSDGVVVGHVDRDDALVPHLATDTDLVFASVDDRLALQRSSSCCLRRSLESNFQFCIAKHCLLKTNDLVIIHGDAAGAF